MRLFAAALAVAVAGCRPDAEVRGSGTVAAEQREIGDYRAVTLAGFGELVLAAGPAPRLEVEAEDNLLPLLRSDLGPDGHLELGFAPGAHVRPRRPVVFRLNARAVDAVTLVGAAKLTAPGPLTLPRLEVSAAGSNEIALPELTAGELVVRLTRDGTLTAAGTADRLTLLVGGTAEVRAKGLRARAADVTLTGGGRATVWATDELTAAVKGSGEVRYKGTPKVSADGSGRPAE
jgi:hypothetical protein